MNKVPGNREKVGVSGENLIENQVLVGIPVHNYEIHNSPPSINELRKIIKQLQIQLQKQKEMRKEVEQNFKVFQKRSILRQKQFHNILQVSNKQVKMFKTGEDEVQCIKKTYQDIFKNFQNNNNAMNQLIQKKYKQNLYTMERKVSSILDVFNSEIAKNKRISNQSIKQIKSIIEKALMMVQSVEDENVELRVSLKNQRYRTQLMHEERRLLLQEMTKRKVKMSKLLIENKKYKQILKLQTPTKLSKDIDEKQSKTLSKAKENEQSTDINQNQKLNTLSSTFFQFESREHAKYSNGKFIHELLEGQENCVRQKSDGSPNVSRQSSISGITNKKLLKNHLTFNFQGINCQKNQIKFINRSKKYTVKSQCKNSVDFCSKAPIHYRAPITKTNTASQSFNDCAETEKTYNVNGKVIQHLKLCLERERKKVSELGRIVSKFQGRNEEVNDAILQALSHTREQFGKDPNNSLESLLKSQKLLEIIADMKRRLSMCEKPTIGCGWGEVDLQPFLQH